MEVGVEKGLFIFTPFVQIIIIIQMILHPAIFYRIHLGPMGCDTLSSTPHPF